jgi:hypothetical protein
VLFINPLTGKEKLQCYKIVVVGILLLRLKALSSSKKGKYLRCLFIIFQQYTAAAITYEKEVFAQSDVELISTKKFTLTVLRGNTFFNID